MKNTLLLPLLLLAPAAHSAGIDYAIGAGVSYANIEYSDDDGDTVGETLVFPLRIFGELKMDKINKFQAGFRMVDFDIDATTDGDMGATFEGSQFDGAWLHQLRLGRDFKPWLGVGVRVSFLEVTGKHRVDQDGYLIERYEPVSETLLSPMAIAYYEWAIGRSGWFVDSSLTYEIPMSDGFEGIGAGIGVKCEF